MMPPHLRPVLGQLEQALRELLGDRLRELRLFGSYARGEATEDSDVDVLVLVDRLAPRELALISDTTLGVALATGISLAPLPIATDAFDAMTRDGRALALEIARDGAPA